MKERSRFTNKTLIFLFLLLLLTGILFACADKKENEPDPTLIPIDLEQKEYSLDTKEMLFTAYKTAMMAYHKAEKEEDLYHSYESMRSYAEADEEMQQVIEEVFSILSDARTPQREVFNFCNYVIDNADKVTNALYSCKTETGVFISQASAKTIHDAYKNLIDILEATTLSKIATVTAKKEFSRECLRLQTERDDILVDIRLTCEAAGESFANVKSALERADKIAERWILSETSSVYENCAWTASKKYTYDGAEDGDYLYYKLLSNAVKNDMISVEKANAVAASAQEKYRIAAEKRTDAQEEFASVLTGFPSTFLSASFTEKKCTYKGTVGTIWEEFKRKKEEVENCKNILSLLEDSYLIEQYLPRACNLFMSGFYSFVTAINNSSAVQSPLNDASAELAERNRLSAETIKSFYPYLKDIINDFSVLQWAEIVPYSFDLGTTFLKNNEWGKEFAPKVEYFSEIENVQDVLKTIPKLLLTTAGDCLTELTEEEQTAVIEAYLAEDRSEYRYDMQYIRSTDEEGQQCYFVWLFSQPITTVEWKKMYEENGSAIIKANATHRFATYEEMKQWTVDNDYHLSAYFVPLYFYNEQEITKKQYRCLILTGYQILLSHIKGSLLPQKEKLLSDSDLLLSSFEEAFARDKIVYNVLTPKVVSFDEILEQADLFLATDCRENTEQADEYWTELKNIAWAYLRAKMPAFFAS